MKLRPLSRARIEAERTVGFEQGMACAVAMLLRRGDDVQAEEIWREMGVPVPSRTVAAFDRRVLMRALRGNWGRG